jgi:hypothetical protein
MAVVSSSLIARIWSGTGVNAPEWEANKAAPEE